MTNAQSLAHRVSQTVLVVEDDQLLQALMIDILEDAGFATLQAGNADEALAFLNGRHDIDVLLTDINMPGSMDGLQLAHAVCARWPLIRIVVVSARNGVSETDLPAEGRFFQKPYHAAALISAIRCWGSPAVRDSGDRVYLDVEVSNFAQTRR